MEHLNVISLHIIIFSARAAVTIVSRNKQTDMSKNPANNRLDKQTVRSRASMIREKPESEVIFGMKRSSRTCHLSLLSTEKSAVREMVHTPTHSHTI